MSTEARELPKNEMAVSGTSFLSPTQDDRMHYLTGSFYPQQGNTVHIKGCKQSVTRSVKGSVTRSVKDLLYFLEWLLQPTVEFAGSITVISMEIGTGKPSSNAGLVCCSHFRTSTLGKSMNLSLFTTLQLWVKWCGWLHSLILDCS